jgi:hypothetical protein
LGTYLLLALGGLQIGKYLSRILTGKQAQHHHNNHPDAAEDYLSSARPAPPIFNVATSS